LPLFVKLRALTVLVAPAVVVEPVTSNTAHAGTVVELMVFPEAEPPESV
jgi:hypothetical protein